MGHRAMEQTDSLETFGKAVLKLRTDAGLTQKKLADDIGCQQSDISDLEKGKKTTPPNKKVLSKLFDKLADSPEKEEQFTKSFVYTYTGRLPRWEEWQRVQGGRGTSPKTDVRLHITRQAAHEYICERIRERKAQKIDLIQFSGVYAVPILQTAADACPELQVRLLLVSRDVAERYDVGDRSFNHWNRVNFTIGQCQLIKQSKENISVEIWHYSVPPSVAGVIVDDWMVVAGWYHVLVHAKIPEVLIMRGHAAPAVTAIDEDPANTKSLLAFVRQQFDSTLHDSRHQRPRCHPRPGRG